MSRRGKFWTGFGVGAGVGVVSVLLPQLVGRAGASRILRLEKSIQVGRPVEEVFRAWMDWDRLPRVSEHIASIRHRGDRSHWRVKVRGKSLEWDALTEQFIQNQAIGWKSINGPRHTGRITFSPLGDNTVIHVTMNYVPPLRFLRPLMSSMTGHMEGLIETVLREFKASVESGSRGAQEAVRTGTNPPGPGTGMAEMPLTGTFGAEPAKVEPRFGTTVNPVDYTSPPDAKR